MRTHLVIAHTVKDSSLRLSWRTDRIPKAELEAVEARLEGVLGK